ncbi:MAG: motif domain protein [Fibrobacteres bacterium]|nr:motif domain protein [Fibrobacterota bacterium]
MENETCSCDTKKPFSECCEPVLKRTRQAESPAALMRARYSAFVRHEIDFLMDSVSPVRRKEFDRKGIEDWSRDTDWAGLEILSTEKGGPEDDKGSVEFIAKFREKDEEQKHHELATFVKIKGAWYFDDGRTPPAKPVKSEGPKVGRNDPCPCGSGKKFKKCHGVMDVAA